MQVTRTIRLTLLAVLVTITAAACTPQEQADGNFVLRTLAEWCARG